MIIRVNGVSSSKEFLVSSKYWNRIYFRVSIQDLINFFQEEISKAIIDSKVQFDILIDNGLVAKFDLEVNMPYLSKKRINKLRKYNKKIVNRYENYTDSDLINLNTYLKNKSETSKVIVSIITAIFIAIFLGNFGQNIATAIDCNFLPNLIEKYNLWDYSDEVEKVVTILKIFLILVSILAYVFYLYLFRSYQKSVMWLEKYIIDRNEIKKDKISYEN